MKKGDAHRVICGLYRFIDLCPPQTYTLAQSRSSAALSQHSSKLSRLLAYTPYLHCLVSALSCDPDALAPDVFGTTSARYPLSRSARTLSLLSFD